MHYLWRHLKSELKTQSNMTAIDFQNLSNAPFPLAVSWCYTNCLIIIIIIIIVVIVIIIIIIIIIHSFIHSFGHFYSAPSSPLLLRGAPDYSTDTVSEFHAE